VPALRQTMFHVPIWAHASGEFQVMFRGQHVQQRKSVVADEIVAFTALRLFAASDSANRYI
jgi:hypothetical protein